MESDYLKTYIAVIESGSFTKAEERLFLSKQAIMRQINQLENETGQRLLNRGKQGIEATPAGEVFYHGAQKIIAIERKTMLEMQDAEKCSSAIRLSNIDYHVLLDPVTVLFHQRFPNIQIKKVFHPNTLEAQLVEQDIIDIGDTLYHPRYTEGKFRYEPLLKMEYFCISMQPFEKAVVSPQSLREMPILVDDREFADYYAFHLDKIKALFPCAQIISSKERRVDIIASAIHAGKIVITASTFARSIDGFYICPLDVDFYQQCGIVYLANPRKEISDYITLAHQVYPT